MSTADKLAVLVPVFNGGRNLAASLRSCAASGLHPDQYEIIVVDNGSTDDAVSKLPAVNPGGAPVRVFSNGSNIGRVQNWNRALEIAADLGFRWVTFLFAGDVWIPGNALRDLFRAVRNADASVAFAPFVVAGSNGVKRPSQRFHVNGAAAVCSSREFVSTLLASGLFPLGPLQANIYRIDAGRLVFDPSEPTRTDVDSTLRFIIDSGGPVVVGGEPFVEWQDRPDRFHASMGTARTVQDYMATFQLACSSTDRPVNYSLAKARILLNSLRLMISDAPLLQWPSVIAAIARSAFSAPHPVRPRDVLESLWSRFALGRRLLQFG